MNIDYSADLCRLLDFVSETATGIRMNSAYNRASEFEPNARVDAMWLSDALHNLGVIGRAIISGDEAQVVRACDQQIRIFQQYQSDSTGHNSKASFDRWSRFEQR